MKKILVLTKVMMKNTYSGMAVSKKKKTKGKKLLGFLGILFLYLYLSIIIFFASRDLLKSFMVLEQNDLLLNFVFSGSTLYILVVAVLTIPSIFYFSRDLDYLLPMPLKPIEIITAKSITTYVSLLLSLSFILIPFGFAYQLIVKSNIVFLLLYLLATLIVPIIPLAVSILFIVLIFKFVPKVNNKDVFTYISSFLMIALIVFINTSTIGNDNMINNIISNKDVLSVGINRIIPTIEILTNAVIKNSLLNILFALIISLSLIFLVIKLISPVYFKGAIGISESAKQSRKGKTKKYKSKPKINSKLSALLKMDLKNIFRTPVFAINYLLPIFLLPIIMLIPLLKELSSGLNNTMLVELVQEARIFVNEIELLNLIPYVIMGSFSLTLLMSAMSSVASTALSREGERMEFYKSLPINMLLIINAKILIGIGVSLFLPTIILLILALTLWPKMIIIFIALITILITATFTSVFDITFDVYKPKLIWDNETQAIKQNFITIIPIFSSFLIIGLLIYIFIKFSNFPLLVSVSILILFLTLSILIYKIVIKKYGLNFLNKAIEKL